MRLHDRVFLLLGGTGGIGKALVEPLVRAGARVIIASRHPEKLEHREGVSLAHLDLSAPDLDQQLDRLGDAYPDIDGVIHCAGQNRFASLGNMAVSDLDAQIAVNLRSAMIVARHFAPRFERAGQGALVFVGSTFGSIGFPGYTAYCASKFGLRGFTEALRRELADTPVQVIYVAPRATATDMNPEAVNELNRALGNAMDAPEAVASQILAAMENDDRRRFHKRQQRGGVPHPWLSSRRPRQSQDDIRDGQCGCHKPRNQKPCQGLAEHRQDSCEHSGRHRHHQGNTLEPRADDIASQPYSDPLGHRASGRCERNRLGSPGDPAALPRRKTGFVFGSDSGHVLDRGEVEGRGADA